MVLLIAALAVFVLGVVEVTIVASPAGLSVSTFAGFVFRVEPPVGLVVAPSAPLHSVAGWVADMASRAGPIVLCVVAFAAVFVFWDVLLAVFAMPVGFCVAALGTVLIRGNFKVAVSAQPAH